MSRSAAEEKYGSIAEQYDERYVGPRWDLYDHVTLHVAGTHMPPAPARVLDAGAGSGKFALKLLRLGHDLTLLDPSEEMLAVARRKIETSLPGAKAQFVPGTIEKLPFPDAAFDFVFCEGDPLSYCITTHRDAAKEIMRVLRPGGGFYASLDNRWHYALAMIAMGHAEQGLAAAETGAATDPYGVPVHAFRADEIRDVFHQAGAADVQVSGKIGLAHFLPDQTLLPLLQDNQQRARLYALETRLATDPHMCGLAGHLHVTGRKP